MKSSRKLEKGKRWSQDGGSLSVLLLVGGGGGAESPPRDDDEEPEPMKDDDERGRRRRERWGGRRIWKERETRRDSEDKKDREVLRVVSSIRTRGKAETERPTSERYAPARERQRDTLFVANSRYLATI